MQDIEPFYQWREWYVASEDERSPFYGVVYSEFEFSNTHFKKLILEFLDILRSLPV